MRHYHYSLHCAEYKPAFHRSIVFSTASDWFNLTLSRIYSTFKYDPLRNMDAGRGRMGHCPHTRSFVGWHLSYFLPGEQIVNKLRSFSHQDQYITRSLSRDDRDRLIAKRARSCVTARGKKLVVELLPYAGIGNHARGALPRSSTLPPPASSASAPGRRFHRPQHPDAASLRSSFRRAQIEDELLRCKAALKIAAGTLKGVLPHEPRALRAANATPDLEAGWLSNLSWGSAWRVVHPCCPPVQDNRVPVARKMLWLAMADHVHLRESCATLKEMLRWPESG